MSSTNRGTFRQISTDVNEPFLLLFVVESLFPNQQREMEERLEGGLPTRHVIVCVHSVKEQVFSSFS